MKRTPLKVFGPVVALVAVLMAAPVSAHTITWNPNTYTTPITDWADGQNMCALITTWNGGHADPAQYYALDVALPSWTPIYSTKGGYAWYEWNTGGGHMVKINHAESGGTFTTVLAHLVAYHGDRVGPNYANRRWVNKNVIIAWSGASGQVTGPHLHWAMHVSDHMTQAGYGANLDWIPGVEGGWNPRRVCGVEH
jgi:murein DD-endopeptidase MepM/ murein hydrolase activator NlpD